MKTFKNLIAIALFGAILFSCKSAPKEEKIPVAIQIYSLRDNLEKDFVGTLAAVKDMGYDGLELAGLYGNTPEQVKFWCDSLGLVPISAHVALAEMQADIDKVISDYKTIGCEYIAVPFLPEELRPAAHPEEFKATVASMAEIAKKVKAAGMTLLYHNHDFEFQTLEDGTYGLDYIYANTPADELQSELDLCWIKYFGEDPAEYLRKYADRAPLVHFKDYYFEGPKEGDPYALLGDEETAEAPKTVFEFRPLGCGLQDVPALVEAFKDAHSKWIIVEQDNPSMGMCPMMCMKKGLDNLNRVLYPDAAAADDCCKAAEGDCCKAAADSTCCKAGEGECCKAEADSCKAEGECCKAGESECKAEADTASCCK